MVANVATPKGKIVSRFPTGPQPISASVQSPISPSVINTGRLLAFRMRTNAKTPSVSTQSSTLIIGASAGRVAARVVATGGMETIRFEGPAGCLAAVRGCADGDVQHEPLIASAIRSINAPLSARKTTLWVGPSNWQ